VNGELVTAASRAGTISPQVSGPPPADPPRTILGTGVALETFPRPWITQLLSPVYSFSPVHGSDTSKGFQYAVDVTFQMFVT